MKAGEKRFAVKGRRTLGEGNGRWSESVSVCKEKQKTERNIVWEVRRGYYWGQRMRSLTPVE